MTNGYSKIEEHNFLTDGSILSTYFWIIGPAGYKKNTIPKTAFWTWEPQDLWGLPRYISLQEMEGKLKIDVLIADENPGLFYDLCM